MADTPASGFGVTVSAGTLRAERPGWTVPHTWTDAGAVVEAAPNGAAVLHVAVALCVLNDVFREGRATGLEVAGVTVSARGEFDETTWQSTGVTYSVEVESPASGADIAALLAHVDRVAEIPRALRAGMTVERAS
jgi:hypothetical protein